MKRKLQKLASYIYPIQLESVLSEYSNIVEVFLDRGEYMLVSADAMYSYGLRYAPFKKAFAFLDKQKKLSHCNNFLLLGGGFGSAVLQLHLKYKYPIQSTIVERDAVIVRLAKKYFPVL
jgi:spermidine synthase